MAIGGGGRVLLCGLFVLTSVSSGLCVCVVLGSVVLVSGFLSAVRWSSFVSQGVLLSAFDFMVLCCGFVPMLVVSFCDFVI